MDYHAWMCMGPTKGGEFIVAKLDKDGWISLSDPNATQYSIHILMA